MRNVRSRDTTPEVIFRKALWANGLRYRICSENLPGKPDVVLPSKRLAVFVDGDFWHGSQWARRNLTALEDQFSKTQSKEYWIRKIHRNIARDFSVTASLLADGWTVLRFWESQIKKDLQGCVQLTVEAASNGVRTAPWSFAPQRTYADFFAGIGLMRIGLEKQGWYVQFANDIDPQKYKMYEKHFSDASHHYILADVHNIDPHKVPRVTLATASFPCNDLSLAGSRGGLAGEQSSAFWGFLRIIEELDERRPPLVLLENVTGFLTSHKGQDFTDALLALNTLGYSVDAFIIDAVHFLPQSRKRLFVIGVINDGPRIGGPPGILEPSESETRPKALIDFIVQHPEIRWNIRPLPSLPCGEAKLRDIVQNLDKTAVEWWSPKRAEYLLNQMSARHREVAERMIRMSEWSFGTVFRRIRKGKSMAELRTDGIAGCLRTPRGGSGRQILFKAGKGQYFARFLTPRECARLMGANDYKIDAPLNQALFGFGDAVCVPIIEWIAKHYLNPVVSESLRGRPLRLLS